MLNTEIDDAYALSGAYLNPGAAAFLSPNGSTPHETIAYASPNLIVESFVHLSGGDAYGHTFREEFEDASGFRET